jgi:hypothetical protein
MKVHNSALKHGVLPQDAAQAADWPLWVEPIDEGDWPHRELRFDTHARLLETVVLIFESSDEMVIHASQLASSTGTSFHKQGGSCTRKRIPIGAPVH